VTSPALRALSLGSASATLRSPLCSPRFVASQGRWALRLQSEPNCDVLLSSSAKAAAAALLQQELQQQKLPKKLLICCWWSMSVNFGGVVFGLYYVSWCFLCPSADLQACVILEMQKKAVKVLSLSQDKKLYALLSSGTQDA
jgi:hypothetical protein